MGNVFEQCNLFGTYPRKIAVARTPLSSGVVHLGLDITLVLANVPCTPGIGGVGIIKAYAYAQGG